MLGKEQGLVGLLPGESSRPQRRAAGTWGAQGFPGLWRQICKSLETGATRVCRTECLRAESFTERLYSGRGSPSGTQLRTDQLVHVRKLPKARASEPPKGSEFTVPSACTGWEESLTPSARRENLRTQGTGRVRSRVLHQEEQLLRERESTAPGLTHF